jgi:hypothetical protein
MMAISSKSDLALQTSRTLKLTHSQILKPEAILSQGSVRSECNIELIASRVDMWG